MARIDATELVLTALRTQGPASRTHLARSTGLAESTVSVTVGDLLAEGVLEEAEADHRPGRTGRPPVVVRLARMAGLVLGIDLGKTHARLALADLGHTVLAERMVDIEEDQPARTQIAQVRDLMCDVLDEADASGAEIVSAGLGLPGPVHRPSGLLGDSTILPGWVGVNAAEAMSAALGVPVVVDNDANLGALGEWTWGAARGVDTAVYLKVSTGVGAGLIVAGRPFAGSTGTAGEIGHTVLDPQGPRCRCGNRGCLEVLAGSQAVLRAAGVSGREGEAGLRLVVAAAENGDPRAVAAIAESGRAVGAALATLCNLVNPERVVLGGTLATAGPLITEPMLESLASRAIRSAVHDDLVVSAVFEDRAEVLGAVVLALREGLPLRHSTRLRAG